MKTEAEFVFHDNPHSGYYYIWHCKVKHIPRVGDSVSLPGLEGGGPIYAENNEESADKAIVESITWWLNERHEDKVSIYCDMVWIKRGE